MPDPGRSVRVVLADDDEAQRVLLRRLLKLVPRLEVVGEARDGDEAVRLVQSTAPDLVLLDVDMPHLDGPSAAELIRSYHPEIRILIHSAAASPQKRQQAMALGLPILEKTLLRDTMRLVQEMAAETRPMIEPLVLLALADHAGAGVLIVSADGTIPFYNGRAASMLHLPLPAERLSLETMRERVQVLDDHSQSHDIELLPLSRALAAHVATTASVLCEFVDDGSQRRFDMASIPFFNPAGEFLGVGNYLSDDSS
jgi:CheY-like chemotaxis protein